MLVPAVLTVLMKMNLCLWEMIIQRAREFAIEWAAMQAGPRAGVHGGVEERFVRVIHANEAREKASQRDIYPCAVFYRNLTGDAKEKASPIRGAATFGLRPL